jgi:poly(3-hydroxybutyrate) depolymerase
MHGGGGCAVHEVESSGFKDLSDAEGSNTFITVWPQGASEGPFANQWPSCGSDCNSARGQAVKDAGKGLASWDEIGFLEQMITNIVKTTSSSQPWKDRVDPERIYMTGFSMGCMMAHRFALERSKVVAGFGCHGGELSLIDTDVASELDAEKTKYNLQPMPTYITIGTDDTAWYDKAVVDWRAWSYLNGCSGESTRAVNLSSSSRSWDDTAAVEHVGHSCASYSPPLETVMMSVTGGGHANDHRMAKFTWDFLRQYTRPGALVELPVAVIEVDPPTTTGSADDTASSASTETRALTPVALALAAAGLAAWGAHQV